MALPMGVIGLDLVDDADDGRGRGEDEVE